MFSGVERSEGTQRLSPSVNFKVSSGNWAPEDKGSDIFTSWYFKVFFNPSVAATPKTTLILTQTVCINTG